MGSDSLSLRPLSQAVSQADAREKSCEMYLENSENSSGAPTHPCGTIVELDDVPRAESPISLQTNLSTCDGHASKQVLGICLITGTKKSVALKQGTLFCAGATWQLDSVQTSLPTSCPVRSPALSWSPKAPCFGHTICAEQPQLHVGFIIAYLKAGKAMSNN